MTPLSEEQCTACRADAPPVPPAERQELLVGLPAWHIDDVEGIPHLVRRFDFQDFMSAVAFTNAVAALAEEADHHPAILTEWGKVTVSWWTHKIRNLHRNDFILAARCDQAYTAAPGAKP